ncbi:MAG: NUDIX domain-containing protein [Bacteroides sp.]|nr:NUDIX domain-containing protein [Bacteroides sp.]MCM1434392.1 NUDIX domain-containing protein [Clostridiales bacterium]
MSEIWDVYDENRNVTGKIIRRDGHFCDENEYHLVVHVWIKNSKNEWLISKRTPNKHFPLMWECTGGSVIAGEDSLQGALREVKEELGISLGKDKGRLYKSFKRSVYHDFCDVWIFEHDCDIGDVVLQEDETCDSMWASSDKIFKLIDDCKFVPLDNMQYVYELLKI